MTDILILTHADFCPPGHLATWIANPVPPASEIADPVRMPATQPLFCGRGGLEGGSCNGSLAIPGRRIDGLCQVCRRSGVQRRPNLT